MTRSYEHWLALAALVASTSTRAEPAEVAASTPATPPSTSPTAAWVESDTWAATDALGRKLPTSREAGPRRPGKQVAMFYWTWHTDGQVGGEPVNVELISRRHPEAVNDYAHPIWKRMGTGYHWDEPLLGYYRATDPWVLRRHAEMLADAGVDAIIFDATNGSFTWKTSYDVLLPVFAQARRDGVRAPQIAFLLPFGPFPHSLASIRQLWKDIYEPRRHEDLWFRWKGKPLIMAYPDNVPEPMRSFFTFRPGQPVYKTGPTRPDHWGWLEIHPQHGFVETAPGRYEQVPVGVAQNATDALWPAAMNDRAEVYGRGYTTADGPDHSPAAIASGLNFAEQWRRALELDPELVFVTGWNEWIAGRHREWQGTENAFPDQFDDEYSRDIEPVRGGFGDSYYHQLVANVRRFKGAAPPPPVSAATTIRIDGEFDDWKDVRPVYRDHRGDTMRRDHPGYGSRTVHRNATGRNDLLRAQVARDAGSVYFRVQTAGAITPPEGGTWMMLLLDADRDRSTGWEGYEHRVLRRAPDGPALLEWSDRAWKWQPVGEVAMRHAERGLELAIPRAYLGASGHRIDLELKWVDNMLHEGDVMDFYQYGDAAPGGRFNYVYREPAPPVSASRSPSAPGSTPSPERTPSPRRRRSPEAART